MKEHGWRLRPKIRGGKLSFEFEDRILLLHPQIWKLSDDPPEFQIDLNPQLTTRRFLDYCNVILDKPTRERGFAFYLPHPPMRLFVPIIDEPTAHDAAAKVITWGKRLDLRDCLRTNLSYPNEAAPLFTVYRLIAMKFDGRDADLQTVLSDVQTWSSQGYDIHITPDRVKRAIALDSNGGF